MAFQSNSNAIVAYKVQSALGSQASGAGGTQLRVSGGGGGSLTMASTASNEIRSDGMVTRGRHGTQKTAGAWTGELSLGSHEKIMEAVMRDTWSTADLTTTQADFTSLTTTTGAIVLASGNPITLGYRVGDVIELLTQDAGNNSRNLRITGLSATTITVAETLILNATPDTTCSIVRRGKKLIQSGTLVKRYFTVDEYDVDIDLSEVMTDFVWSKLRFAMTANGEISCDPDGMGTGQFSVKATGTSPFLTSPTLSAGLPMSVVDATIRLGGSDQVALSSFDLTIDIVPNAPDVFGSGTIKYSPDVFTGQTQIGINFTALRTDLQLMADYLAEVVYSFHILAVENTAEPKNFISIFVPNATLGGVVKSALSKQGGGRTVAVSVPPALIGIDNTGTGYDACMIKFQSTGA